MNKIQGGCHCLPPPEDKSYSGCVRFTRLWVTGSEQACCKWVPEFLILLLVPGHWLEALKQKIWPGSEHSQKARSSTVACVILSWQVHFKQARHLQNMIEERMQYLQLLLFLLASQLLPLHILFQNWPHQWGPRGGLLHTPRRLEKKKKEKKVKIACSPYSQRGPEDNQINSTGKVNVRTLWSSEELI